MLLLTLLNLLSAEPFYFTQLTDTHWGKADNLERTAAVVKAIGKLPVEINFTLHSGDITNDKLLDSAVLAEGLATMGKLDHPVHYLSGNHDAKGDALLLQSYKKHFGELITVTEYEPFFLITLCTEPLRTGKRIDGFDPFTALEAALEECGEKEVIVAHHGASVADFYSNRMHDGWSKERAAAWKELLNKHNVCAVLAGHFHRDELHWLGAVPVYVCAPVDASWGRQTSFRLYEWTSQGLGYRTVYSK